MAVNRTQEIEVQLEVALWLGRSRARVCHELQSRWQRLCDLLSEDKFKFVDFRPTWEESNQLTSLPIDMSTLHVMRLSCETWALKPRRRGSRRNKISMSSKGVGHLLTVVDIAICMTYLNHEVCSSSAARNMGSIVKDLVYHKMWCW